MIVMIHHMEQPEIMYFLIEPVFERAGTLEAQWSSDSGIANIITRMIHYHDSITKEISTMATQVFIIAVRACDSHDYFRTASGVFFPG